MGKYKSPSPSIGVMIPDPLCNLLGSKPQRILLENLHTPSELKIPIAYVLFSAIALFPAETNLPVEIYH